MSEESKKNKILILDDDKFLLNMYSGKFVEAGAEVETAELGEELLNKLRAGLTPDLVILDIIVPSLSGLEVLEFIRKENLIPKAKIIMLTNESNPEEIEKAKNLNINGYIVKAVATPSEVVEQAFKVLESKE